MIKWQMLQPSKHFAHGQSNHASSAAARALSWSPFLAYAAARFEWIVAANSASPFASWAFEGPSGNFFGLSYLVVQVQNAHSESKWRRNKRNKRKFSRNEQRSGSRWFSRMLSAGNPRNLQGFSVAADGLLQATLLAGKGHNLWSWNVHWHLETGLSPAPPRDGSTVYNLYKYI